MALAPGTRIGVYDITAQLGEGGMGQVFRATDSRLKREVAIKILPPAVAADAERLARFRREAEVLASLNHPNIAAIYGLEESPSTGSGQAGVTALVMELVEGDDLSERIARGAIPLDEALPVAKQITQALEAAHEQGIIHRDLKPANIKVRADGTVKVLDFGLAKAMDPAGASSASASALANSPTITSPAMTQMGMILGTAAYMSPEQARGKAVDRRADIWAFGAVLYEMLTGRSAFAGEDVSLTLSHVLQVEPDWGLLPKDLSPTLLVYLRRCLQKDPKQRIGDIRDVRLALEGAFDIPAAIAPVANAIAPPRPLWRRALPVPAAVVLGAALAGGTVWNLRPVPPTPAVTRFTIPLPEGQQFTNTGRISVAISPDGARMVYVANQRLYLRSLSGLDVRPIPGTEELAVGYSVGPVFSPDGQSIAFYAGRDRTIKKIAVTGGVAVTLCPVAINPLGMSWGPEGIVFGQGGPGVGAGSIMRVLSTGGAPEVLVRMGDGEALYGPQLLPDGQHVLFSLSTVAGPTMWDESSIVVQSLATKARKVIVEKGSDGRYLSTGHVVYAEGGTLFAVAFDAARLEVRGGPVPVVEGVSRSPRIAIRTPATHFSVSDSGSLIFIPGPASSNPIGWEWNLALIDRRGVIEPLKFPPGTYSHPRVSPDGTRIAFETTNLKEAFVSVYDFAGGTAPRRLTFGGNNRFPVWSRDGRRVTFQSDRDGDPAIFWQLADGTGVAERLTKPDKGAVHVPSSWSPRDETLLFSVAAGRDASLWTFTRESRKEAPFGGVLASTVLGAVFSPDGRWVAYSSDESATRANVYIQPFPATGAKYQLPANGGAPHHQLWSPDGKELFYNPRAGAFEAVAVTTQPTFAFGNPAAVPRPFQMAAPSTFRDFDITPGGKFVGLVAPGPSGPMTSEPREIQVVVNWFTELKARVPTK